MDYLRYVFCGRLITAYDSLGLRQRTGSKLKRKKKQQRISMPEINRAEHIIAVFRALSIALQLNLILIGSTLQLVFYCYE